MDGDIGAMMVFERLELLQCGINVTVREAVVAIEEVLPGAPTITLGGLFHLDVGRAFSCGGVQLLIQEGVVLPVEIWRRSSDSSRANRMVDSTLPSPGIVIFHKVVSEINP